MDTFLDIGVDSLERQKANWTAKEISQQPDCWQATSAIIDNVRGALEQWIAPLKEAGNFRVILTGAGTSAYAGQSLAPYLTSCSGVPVEAIASTDLVSNPDQYYIRDIPTLIVSFARSGDSPESVAACQLADQLVPEAFHLIVTCNANSALARFGAGKRNGFSLVMPSETLDQSFAMTSSFTSMMVAVLTIFSQDTAALTKAANISQHIIENYAGLARSLAQESCNRVVFLGSGGLYGVATEARLKLLELTSGRIDCYAETSLGFRHGPKFIIDRETVVVMISSSNAHTSKYDQDLLAELKRDGKAKKVLDLQQTLDLQGVGLDDVWLSFPYTVFCQMFAFFKSVVLHCTPDNPSPDGEVNRVVQGVTIYPFEA